MKTVVRIVVLAQECHHYIHLCNFQIVKLVNLDIALCIVKKLVYALLVMVTLVRGQERKCPKRGGQNS